MRRVPVRSSALVSVGYDARTNELEIEFRSGDTYRYAMVPVSVHEALLQADAPGSFVSREIVPRYPAREVFGD